MRIIFLTLIFALNTPTHSADQKPPVRPWSIENVQNVAKSTWKSVCDNVKKALPQKKPSTPPSKSPTTTTPASSSDAATETPAADGTASDAAQPPASTKKPLMAKALEMIKRWQVALVAWHKTHILPNLKKTGPWIKEKTQALLTGLKKTLPENKSSTLPPKYPPVNTPASDSDASPETPAVDSTASDATQPDKTPDKPEEPSDAHKPEDTSQTPQENTQPPVTPKQTPMAKALEMVKNWQVALVAWYKIRILPNLKNTGPWIKEKTQALLTALKNAKENLKKKQEAYRQKREENRKKPNPARTKRIHHDSYGDFGYDGFNLHKGSKRDSFTPDTLAIDPEVYFEQRTDVRTEPPAVEEKKPEQTTFMARLGGVPSGRISRFTMAFTGLAEHNHNLKDLALNSGITLLAHTSPDLHKRLPSAAITTRLLPLDIDDTQTLNAHSKRMLFLAHANLLQYLVSHCIAYKSVPEGLKKALWDDTNTRNFVGMVAGFHLLKKDALGDKAFKQIPDKAKYFVVISLLVGIAKIILDQFIESRNLLLLVKRDLAGKPHALGIKEGPLPIEMLGKRYIVFNSVLSKIASTLVFGLNMLLSGVIGPDVRRNGDLAPIFVIPAVSTLALSFKALFSIHNTYLLESDLEHLTPEIRARVVQHATSHKILSSMMYTSTLALFAQLGVQLPTIMRAMNKKKPIPFKLEILEQLKANLPQAQQATIKIDPSKLEYDYQDANTRELLVNLLLLNLQQSTDPEIADLKATVKELLEGERGPKSDLLTWLNRYNRHYFTYAYQRHNESDADYATRLAKLEKEARSPVFTTEINDPSDPGIPQTLMNLLAQDIRDKLANP